MKKTKEEVRKYQHSVPTDNDLDGRVCLDPRDFRKPENDALRLTAGERELIERTHQRERILSLLGWGALLALNVLMWSPIISQWIYPEFP